MGVFSGPTSILSDTSITLRKINKAIFGCIFETSEILVRDISETSKRRHGIDIFFEICGTSHGSWVHILPKLLLYSLYQIE